MGALESTEDGALARFALRVLLSDHVAIPREGKRDWLAEAEVAFRLRPVFRRERRRRLNLPRTE